MKNPKKLKLTKPNLFSLQTKVKNNNKKNKRKMKFKIIKINQTKVYLLNSNLLKQLQKKAVQDNLK